MDSTWEVLLVAILVGALALTWGHAIRQGRWALLLLLAFSVAGAKTFVYQRQLPHGLVGRYRVEPPGVGPLWERTLHHPLTDATRLDAPLAFYNSAYRSGKRPFPFFFLNDQRRHPWVGGPATVKPTVHVQWAGYLLVESPGPASFRLETPDSCGLTVDNQVLTEPGQGLDHCGREVSADLEAGLHRIEVTYSQHISDLNALPAQSRLVLQWRRGAGSWETVPAEALFPQPVTGEALARDRRMRPLAKGLFLAQGFLLALGLLALGTAVPIQAWRGERGKLACWAIVLVGVALVMTLRDARNPSSNYIFLGADPSAYESESRAYITESWVTIPSAGHESKVVYTYFVALAHMFFGEPLVLVILLQRLVLVAAAFVVYWIGKTTYGPRVGLYALVLTAISTHMLGWSRALFPATLAAFLLALTFGLCLQGHRQSSALWTLGAGVTMGLSLHTRPNFILFPALVLLWLATTHRPWRRCFNLMGAFVLGAGLIEMLARFRSFATYGKLSISQGMLAVNLSRGNPIPAGVDLSGMPDVLPLGLPKHLWAMWAFATQQPLAFAHQWLSKLLYLFGVNILNLDYNPAVFTYEIFFFTAGGVLGAVFALRRYRRQTTFLPLAFFAANGLILMVTSPNLHAFRLMVPLMPLMAVYVGVVLEALDLSWPILASWKINLVRAALFFALMPFRYGVQYALMGAAYLLPGRAEKRPSLAILEDLLERRRATSTLTPRARPIQ